MGPSHQSIPAPSKAVELVPDSLACKELVNAGLLNMLHCLLPKLLLVLGNSCAKRERLVFAQHLERLKTRKVCPEALQKQSLVFFDFPPHHQRRCLFSLGTEHCLARKGVDLFKDIWAFMFGRSLGKTSQETTAIWAPQD